MLLDELKFSKAGYKVQAIRQEFEKRIEQKERDTFKNLTIEEKDENLCVPHKVEIPKSKKTIDKLIDEYIEDTDVVILLGFINDLNKDEEKNRLYKILEEKGIDEQDDEKAIETIKDTLKKEATIDELKELGVFGLEISEDEAKRYAELHIEDSKRFALWSLLYYSSYSCLQLSQSRKIDILGETARKVDEVYKKVFKLHGMDERTVLESRKEIVPDFMQFYKERIMDVIKKYPKEIKAYSRAWYMLAKDYSLKSILRTINDILTNE